MRKHFNKFFTASISVLCLCFALLTSSCTGPEGPAGPPGKDGTTGTAVCGKCHESSTYLLAKQTQYHHSLHYLSETYDYANRTACAPCHNNEGFHEVLITKADTVVAAIPNPTPVNCRTCHFVHKNYDSTDYALTYKEPVKLKYGNQTVDFGNGNLCTMCHQARSFFPVPTVGGDSVNISQFRWGPHYGVNSNVVAGVGGFELTGPMSYPSLNPHKNLLKDGCVTCHMAPSIYSVVGGHSFKMEGELEGTKVQNVSVCANANCHPGATKFDIDGKVTEIKGLIAQLRQILIDKGLLDVSRNTDGNVLNEYIMLPENKPKKFSSLEAGAVLNYLIVAKDRSNGIHNYKYTKALLVNTINALQ
ncbi:MAG: hypothetical protein ACUVQ1_05970 [Candidatus Kapaibacteriales bacterium]